MPQISPNQNTVLSYHCNMCKEYITQLKAERSELARNPQYSDMKAPPVPEMSHARLYQLRCKEPMIHKNLIPEPLVIKKNGK